MELSVKKELTVVSIIVDELSNNENYGEAYSSINVVMLFFTCY